MSYLERLRAIELEKNTTEGTAKTVKSPFGSFGSIQSSHFQKIEVIHCQVPVTDADDNRQHCSICSNFVNQRSIFSSYQHYFISLMCHKVLIS
ncbi:hypothetical protein [Methylobacter sp. BlB1]|uniref:hypothetical protein n=1 Tax=Methylobacter sp. BlB1 TaxID=2785914 RepID=UPI0018932AC2|nr:hypothetical protein [Methylobacter sp. BlB1]MBF6650206.1 hypothetical protein [Methylobacter sp. BlB1]